MPKKPRGHVRAIKIDNKYFPYFEWNVWHNHRWTTHRVGKPAIICRSSGRCEWWIRDQRYFYTHEYCKKCKMTKIKTMQMVLKYGDTLPSNIDQL